MSDALANKAAGSVVTTAKLFRSGRSQAVRLPKEFCFEGDTVRISRTASGVLLEPVKQIPTGEEIDAWFARLRGHNAGEAIPGGRNQPPMQERDWPF